MDKIILRDKTAIEVASMPSINAVTCNVANVTALQTLKDRLTPVNISVVETTNGQGTVVGNFTDLVLDDAWTVKWIPLGIEATFCLREKTEMERIREELAIHDGAIADLGAAVGGTV